jgi:signal transduction histidine kinase
LNRQVEQTDSPAPVASGWLPWYSDNRLHLLAWAQTADGVCGLELETMAFLGRLFPALQRGDEYGAIYQLRDGDGTVLFQSGELPTGKGEPVPAATVPIGSALPHWQVALYRPPELLPGRALITLFGALLLAIFLVAIVAGGSLLLWQARRLRREAMQKTSFVAHVSHELKTPLTTMRMYTEMLAEGRVQDAAKRQRYLDVLVEESQRLARLVNNLLDFSRLDQWRKQYHPAEVDVAALLRETAARQTLRLQQAGLALQLELPETPVTAHLDPDAFAQVLVNLLDNAAKYAASGREVTVTLGKDAGRPTVTVADRGPGIPPAARRQLFTAFHRADDRLTGQQDGTGLGLAIARRLLRDQGGDLIYRDRPGGGAAFVLTLPATPETGP